MIKEEIPVNVSSVVAEMAAELREMIGANIALQLNLEREGLWVKADTGRIEQVVVNLITNGRDAMPEGGTITVETSRVNVDSDFLGRKVRGGPYGEFLPPAEGNYARLSVRQAKIFLPYFTTKAVGKGSGLGLCIVYKIVETSRGGILVDSEPGRGACIEIYLREVEAPIGR